MRLFIAVLIDEPLRGRANQVQVALKSRLGTRGIRWVPPENLHFTLRFLGEQPENGLPEIRAAMQEAVANQRPFEVRVGGLGAFPNLRRPSVVWIGLELGAEAMRALFDRLESALQARRFEPEPRGFHAHLTLARVKRPLYELGQVFQEVRADGLGVLRVDALSLMQSQLHPEGAQYMELERFPFLGER